MLKKKNKIIIIITIIIIIIIIVIKLKKSGKALTRKGQTSSKTLRKRSTMRLNKDHRVLKLHDTFDKDAAVQ